MMKKIPNFPGYYLTNSGDVFRKRNNVLRKLKPWISNYHLNIGLYKNNKRYKFRIHRLVLEVFTGPPPTTNHVARHLNNIPTDNRVENLVWGTQKENMNDKKISNKNRKKLIAFLEKNYPHVLQEFCSTWG